MSSGNLIFLLVLVGGVVTMFSMHRGGGRSHGMGRCCGGHGHGSSDDHGSSEESGKEQKKPLLGKPGSHTHDREPATEGGKRGGS